MGELPKIACWRANDASEILRVEALKGYDEIFLATHSPVKGFTVGGNRRFEIDESTEEKVLDVLAEERRRHAFCVVQGEPGSGKSHLIRWLKVNWPKNGDLVLLLQRADGSLDGALKQLKSELGVEFASLFEGLGTRQKATIEGRSAEFLSGLANRLKPDYYEDLIPPDTAWCGRNDLHAFILSPGIRDHWEGPRRLLTLMDGKGGERNSETASFDLRDIQSLAKRCGSVRGSGVSHAAEQFAGRIIQEAETLSEYLATGLSWADVAIEGKEHLKASLKLCEALNWRRNDAVQNLIGVSASDLKRLFEAVRMGLRGRRMVLLLEDITTWEGLDDRLIDALVTDADTRVDDDFCPLISVVGVTPEYYRKLQGNYKDRITHEIKLGESEDNALQDVATMRESDDRRSFVARYLNATRVGIGELRNWKDRATSGEKEPLPNACMPCAFRSACHDAFGAVEAFGLYPFTGGAIDALFERLKADDAGQTHRTPRGVLQNILVPTLLHPEAIDARAYPGPQIENGAAFERTRFNLKGALRTQIEVQVSDQQLSGRVRRVFVIWGNNSATTTVDERGNEAFAGVRRDITEAFALPWLGDASSIKPVPMPENTVKAVAEPVENPTISLEINGKPTGSLETSTNGADVTPASKSHEAKSSPTSTPATASRPKAPSANRTARLRDEIALVDNDGEIATSSIWNEALASLVKSISAEELGIDGWSYEKLFTNDNIKVANNEPARSQYFVVANDQTLRRGLEAYVELRLGDEQDESSLDYYRNRLAIFLRRLRLQMRSHFETRATRDEYGQPWDLGASVAQILLARAWLRGRASPDAPMHEQFREVLSDELTSAESDPRSRTESWISCLQNTDQQHRKLREILRRVRANDLMDAGSLAGAMLGLRDRRLQLGPRPTSERSAFHDDVKAAISVFEMFFAKLADIPRQELKLLGDRAKELEASLHQTGIRERIEGTNRMVEVIDALDPNAASAAQAKWRAKFVGLQDTLDDIDAVRSVEYLIGDLSDPESVPSRLSSLLGWLASKPAANLKTFRDVICIEGDGVLSSLVAIAEQHIAQAAGGVSLDALQEAGAALSRAGENAKAFIEEKMQ